jgi:site-specific DNA recombinase
MKAGIYCRVSTEDQEREGTSLDSQVSACLAKARELGCETPGDYVFKEAWTGADTDRPKLNELRDLIK